MFKRLQLLGMVLLMFCGFVFGTSAQEDSTLIIGVTTDSSFRYAPLWQNSTTAGYRDALTMLGMVAFDQQAQPVPALAESWTPNEDASVWTVNLRDDAVWSDGEPITAQDVKFTYELVVHPTLLQAPVPPGGSGEVLNVYAGAQAFSEGNADEITGIKVVDDKTLEFTLTAPNYQWVRTSYLDRGILPQHILGDVPLDELIDHPYMMRQDVSSGPYTVTEVGSDGTFWRMERNENYWGAVPEIETIILSAFENNEARWAAMEAGEIDITAVDATQVERFEAVDGVNIISTPGFGMLFVQFNMGAPYQRPCVPEEPFEMRGPVDDVRVRKALAYAIDREEIIDILYEGQGEPIQSGIFGQDWLDNSVLETYAYNPERSLELLADAGWTLNDGGLLVDENGEQMRPLVYLGISGQDGLDLGILLQDYFAEVGVVLDLLLVSRQNLIPTIVEEEFDMFRNAGGNFGADPDFITNYLGTCTGTANWMGYSNQEFDSLQNAGVATIDLDERADIYAQSSLILNQELPAIWIASLNNIFAVSERVQGITGAGSPAYIVHGIENWTLE